MFSLGKELHSSLLEPQVGCTERYDRAKNGHNRQNPAHVVGLVHQLECRENESHAAICNWLNNGEGGKDNGASLVVLPYHFRDQTRRGVHHVGHTAALDEHADIKHDLRVNRVIAPAAIVPLVWLNHYEE